MSEVWKGETIVDKGHEITWSKANGFATARSWEGRYDELFAMISTLTNSYDSIKFARIGDTPVWRLDATVGNTDTGTETLDDPVDTHDLLGNDLQQSTLVNDVLNDLLPASVIRAVKQAYKDFSDGSAYADLTGTITTACTAESIDNGDALELFDDLIAERDSFVASQYVYRRTRTVSKRNTDLKAVFTNVGCVFTKAQVVTVEQIPESLNFTLPDGEWLKKTPTVNAQFGQKTQITYEYWHADEWSGLYYPIATLS